MQIMLTLPPLKLTHETNDLHENVIIIFSPKWIVFFSPGRSYRRPSPANNLNNPYFNRVSLLYGISRLHIRQSYSYVSVCIHQHLFYVVEPYLSFAEGYSICNLQPTVCSLDWASARYPSHHSSYALLSFASSSSYYMPDMK